jgi:hypothetical protein
MKRLQRAILWTVLAAIALLAVFCIVSSFLGMEGPAKRFQSIDDAAASVFNHNPSWTDTVSYQFWGAVEKVHEFFGGAGTRAFFHSTPLVVFWFALLALLAAGLVFFRRLAATPAGLAMHLGSLLIVGGAIWGSPEAHAFRAEHFGSDKVPVGFVRLFPGQTKHRLNDLDFQTSLVELPFSLHLNDFHIDHYAVEAKECRLAVVYLSHSEAEDEPGHTEPEYFDWGIGREIEIPGTGVRVTVLRSLDHARYTEEGDVVQDPESLLPAIEIALAFEDRRRQFWLAPEPGERYAGVPLALVLKSAPAAQDFMEGPFLLFVMPPMQPKSYVSDVEVLEGTQSIGHKIIEVNHPLHRGGYHFYQADVDYSDHYGEGTILRVVSDSGLLAVYLGFFLLVAGAFWRFWIEPAGEYLWNKK